MLRKFMAYGLVGALLIPLQAFANDSMAETAIGGIKLVQSNDISLDSEDLYISEKIVKVNYKFTNHSNKDIKTLVAFPLPAIPYGLVDDYQDYSWPDYNKDLNFKTIFDGKPLNYNIIVTAEVNGKDVTKRVKELGMPIDWIKEDFTNDVIVKKFSNAQIQQFAKEGLLKKLSFANEYMPAWSAVTNVTREEIFPAGKTVSVQHSYKPANGGSVGGALDAKYRNDKDISGNYKIKYCTDKNFFAAFDKKQSTMKKDTLTYTETWIGYILKSGANWKGPIKNFHLTVDKGSPDNLVSFCMNGVKKTSPTKFEVTKTNFEPTKDLNILIIQWVKTGQ